MREPTTKSVHESRDHVIWLCKMFYKKYAKETNLVINPIELEIENNVRDDLSKEAGEEKNGFIFHAIHRSYYFHSIMHVKESMRMQRRPLNPHG